MNLFSVATLSLRLCTSFPFLGGAVSIMARILFGLASITLYDTMNPRNFLLLPRMHIYLDWASCYKSEVCRRFPWDPSNDRPFFGFIPACRQCRLGHFSQSAMRTSCSWASDMSHLRFLGRMALLYSKRGLGWLRTKFSPNLLRPFWSDYNLKKASMNLNNWCWVVKSTRTSTHRKR